MDRIVFAGGTVITMDAGRRVLEDGAVAVAGGRIVAVGSRAEVLAGHGGRVIDTSNHIVLPGLIDAHGHAGHGLVKTMGSGDSAAWYEACRAIYTRHSPPSFWRAEGKLAALERLSFGVTTGLSLLGGGDCFHRVDRPEYGIAHCEGVQAVGIRGILALGPQRPEFPRVYAEGGVEYEVSFEQMAETIETLIRERHGVGRMMMATLMPVYREDVHDPEKVAEIRAQGDVMRGFCETYGVLFHQDGHRAGSVTMAQEMFGLLGPHASLSHSTDLTARDIEVAAETGATIVHNPSAIASVRGYCDVPALLGAGVRVILGSDGTAPDRSTDMFRHMFQCMRLHQRERRDERLMPPGKVLEMVTIDAAEAFGMGAEIGSLEAGKRADVITIDVRKPHLAPRNMPVWRVVAFANGQDVDTVMVDGEILMEGRRFLRVDADAVLDEAEEATERMLTESGLRGLLEEPASLWGAARRA